MFLILVLIFQKKILVKFKRNKPLTHLLSASFGAIVSSFVRVPTDTIRHRVQAYVHPNVFVSVTTIIKQEGIGKNIIFDTLKYNF